jgi:hypothetical protein
VGETNGTDLRVLPFGCWFSSVSRSKSCVVSVGKRGRQDFNMLREGAGAR